MDNISKIKQEIVLKKLYFVFFINSEIHLNFIYQNVQINLYYKRYKIINYNNLKGMKEKYSYT